MLLKLLVQCTLLYTCTLNKLFLQGTRNTRSCLTGHPVKYIFWSKLKVGIPDLNRCQQTSSSSVSHWQPSPEHFFNKLLYYLYSVTKSYANSFWGDVVLDTLNNVSRDEDNILNQIYKANMWFLLWWFLISMTLYKNACLHWIITKTQFYELFFVESCISLNMYFLQSLSKF